MLLALKIEETGHEPKNVGSPISWKWPSANHYKKLDFANNLTGQDYGDLSSKTAKKMDSLWMSPTRNKTLLTH